MIVSVFSFSQLKTSFPLITVYFQKQPLEVFYEKNYLKISQNFQENTGVATDQTPINKRLRHRCVPVNFAKFLGTAFLQNTSGGCFFNFYASVTLILNVLLRSKISTEAAVSICPSKWVF